MPTESADAPSNARQALSGAKTERLGIRVTGAAKSLIERASNLTGRSVSDFVVEKATEAAMKTIVEHDRVVLGEDQRTAFFDALRATYEPSQRVRAAAKRYKQKFDVK